MKAKIDLDSVKKSADTLRDLKNWVSIFSDEHDLSEDAVEQLTMKIDAIAKDLSNVHCVLEDGTPEVENESLQKASDSLRDFKNWVAVFKTENDLSDEAFSVLNEKVEELAESFASVECE